jgi:8-oxo-dGTP pyrophosphatase MutT (NUDIX family)/RimJ/RimL family protein N-acetyltransferase
MLSLRTADEIDIPSLARMSMELTRDEESANPSSIAELEVRLTRLLHEGFVAVIFDNASDSVGFALYRTTPQYVYLREFFITRGHRGNGYGTEAFQRLLAEQWGNTASVQVDVLLQNKVARSFWDSLGFEPRFVRLELETAKKSKSRKACGAVIYRKRLGRIQFLLVHQVSGSFWGFPKGHVDKGESERETAFREVLEETGLRVRFKRGFCERVYYLTQRSRKKEVAFFLSQVQGQSVRIDESEIDDYRWVTYGQALELLPYENLRLLLEKAWHYIKGKHIRPQYTPGY